MMSSVTGSSATTTTCGADWPSLSGSSVVGSTSSTRFAPASASAERRRSHAAPGRASNAARREDSLMVVRGLRGDAEQFVHVPDQFRFLVRLAEVTLHADLERALAMLVAGTRGDHHDRHAAQARVALHRGGQLLT